MIKLLDISLRWKLFIIPAIGTLLTAAFAIVFSLMLLHESRLLKEAQETEVSTIKSILSVTNLLASNHLQIYELMRTAEQGAEEGAFYDIAKPYLYEIHTIERDLKTILSTVTLDAAIIAETNSLLSTLSNYRLNTANALLKASIDITLAKSSLSSSTQIFNILNINILDLMDRLQSDFQIKFKTHQQNIDRYIRTFIFLTGLVAIGMLIFIGISSKYLARDLGRLIKKLSELISDDATNSSPHEVSRDEVTILQRAVEDVEKSNRLLIETQEQLRHSQKLEAIGQLTGGIAHDFNNILGIIQGNFELLKEMFEENTIAFRRIEAGLKAAIRGSDLTRKLLDFSRKQARGSKRVSINQFIADMEDLLVKSLTVSVRVDLHLKDDVWLVDIDPGDLQDAVINLALNARDAMPDGGCLIVKTENQSLDETYVHFHPDATVGEFVILSISDTGQGISEDIKPRILEPFFTTKEQGKGTGLGLSQVYGFIKRSGGHIEIDSEPGLGTTINLFLPRAKKTVNNGNSRKAKPYSLPKGSETILVVDDEEGLRVVAVSHLENLGYETLSAKNSMTALEVLKNNPEIDLLFSDIVMPGQMDGFQLATAAHERYPNLKILLTSGFTSKSSIMQPDSNDYLSDLNNKKLNKPYNLKDLAFTLQNTLNE